MERVKPVQWMLNKSKKERWKMWLLITINAIFSSLSIAFAFAVKMIIDGATKGIKDEIINGAIFICIIVLLQFVLRISGNGLSEHIRGKLEMTYKSHVFSEILNKKYEKITAYHSGEFLTRLSSDVSIVADGVTTIVPTIVSAVVRLLCAVVALVLLDWIFALAFVVCGLMVFIIVGLLRGKLKSFHKRTQETDGKVRSFMQESIENILALKIFSVNKKIEKRAEELQEENFKVKMKRKNFSVLGQASYNLIFSAGYVFALIYGAVKIFNDVSGVFTYGSLSAILQLVNNVQVPFASLSSVFSKYYSTVASVERLIEIEGLESEPNVKQIDDKSTYDKLLSIEGNGLTFGYEKDLVLDNTSFSINKGDTVAIVGTSGIGKSTLLKLMLGVYTPNSGEIFLKLNNGEKVKLDNSTRTMFSFVPQGNMLFSGTLLENITFIKEDATKDEIDRVLEISCAKEFINQLERGVNTKVGENGVGLSEGQMQRIAIARALLSSSPIILLDEATSALDQETEKQLLNNLQKEKNVTIILITHRKSALSICNKVIKLENGKLI